MKISLNNIAIVFLVSRGRSGSTMLQSILDAHPNICAPIESKFVLHLRTKYESKTNWNIATYKSFIEDLFTNRKFRLFWNVTRDELLEKYAEYEVKSFQDACKTVYLCHHSFFAKKSIQLIVDKNPLHSRFTDYLLKIFPNAKFIHLVRDPRAVTFSHVKSLMQKNPTNLAYEWKLLNEKVETVKHSSPQLFHTLRYEDFTSNPDIESRKIFEFIGLPYNPEILNANKIIKDNYQSSTYLSLPHHKNIINPINKLKNNAWKENLTKKEINLINFICHKQLIKYKYDFNPLKPSLLIRLKTFKGKWRSLFKNKLLQFMFSLPFGIRVLIYNIVSLIKDRKYLG